MTLLPARYQCTPSSTRVPRASIWISRRGSSPTSIRTALASSWSTKASSVTAGSSIGSSFRKRRTSAINSFLEGVEADAAIGVDEALAGVAQLAIALDRSEEHTSELQSLMRISYAVFCLKKKKHYNTSPNQRIQQST